MAEAAESRSPSNVSYMRIVDDVTATVITQAELAHAVGASVRTVQNWSRGGAAPRGHTAIRLVDMQYLIGELREVYTDDAIQIWLRSRNRNLGGERPLDLLASDRYDEVLTEAQSIVRGM